MIRNVLTGRDARRRGWTARFDRRRADSRNHVRRARRRAKVRFHRRPYAWGEDRDYLESAAERRLGGFRSLNESGSSIVLVYVGGLDGLLRPQPCFRALSRDAERRDVRGEAARADRGPPADRRSRAPSKQRIQPKLNFKRTENILTRASKKDIRHADHCQGPSDHPPGCKGERRPHAGHRCRVQNWGRRCPLGQGDQRRRPQDARAKASRKAPRAATSR